MTSRGPYASKTHEEIETGGDNNGEKHRCLEEAGGKAPSAETAVAKWVFPSPVPPPGNDEMLLAAAPSSLSLVVVAKWVIPSFFFLDDWRFLFVENVPLDTLTKMRVLCKDWRRVVDKFIDGKIESGVMTVVGENNINWDEARALEKSRRLTKQVIFLLNITKVGNHACTLAINLVVVEIPEGVESIGDCAFFKCTSLTTVSFPTTLRSISGWAFENCSKLDNVDLFHTRLQDIGRCAFYNCRVLKSMTIPDSLQTIGRDVFPYTLYPYNFHEPHGVQRNTAVVAHLRAKQKIKSVKRSLFCE
ncbi:hypothetical protein TrST_g5294 [Triparma strigata]|uniref:Uncharacterized protein n=1 Tax=Triparma strigata TaxID=1606541 RepID=A0A9W7BZY2_9STRA|nr:hypothetical protein TrST_g5294 [Triparma strigata]